MYILLILAAALLAIWWLNDKTVYVGQASAVSNKMKHYSQDSRTLFIMLDNKLPNPRHNLLVATVPISLAQHITALNAPTVPVRVTVRQRWGCEPRVTAVRLA
ncbi:MAG: hypothetical protein HY711_00880 [Candidatus Melainabacteria bacterium]|nr:hypothetical protein [Candidatus Melainabacteria bacterium]